MWISVMVCINQGAQLLVVADDLAGGVWVIAVTGWRGVLCSGG